MKDCPLDACKHRIALLVLTAALVLTASVAAKSDTGLTNHRTTHEIHSTATGNHDPIWIDGDADFAAQAASEGWKGNGSYDFPFAIENLSILSNAYCIWVTNVNAHFVIRNSVFSTDVSYEGRAITFSSTRNGVVDSCLLDSFYMGIDVHNSEDCELMNITVIEVQYGVYFAWSKHCTLMDSRLVHTGLIVEGDTIDEWNHTVVGNTVNGKAMGYFLSAHDLMVPGVDYGQIVLAGCSRVEIHGGELGDTTVGITMALCEDCSVYDSVLSFGVYGATIAKSQRTFLDGITANSNMIWGIMLNDSYSSVLAHCLFSGNGGWGIWCIGSDRSYIANSTIGENSDGLVCIDLQQALVIGNDIHGNGHGVDMQFCRDCILINNTICQNTVTGLELEYECTGNLVCANTIGWNNECNAQDDGINNLWDDGNALGNSWSDYSGGGDYQIPGSAGSIDHFPSKATSTSSTITTDGGSPWNWNQMTQIVTAAAVITIVVFSILIIRNRGTGTADRDHISNSLCTNFRKCVCSSF
ncbi:MAG: hypothetical protein C4K49_05650 [Candidatus Thorarchaeota archaeon]|nr:MAG: hypothetical protein C4K49_05650 [Candidatus Thorarchaeota archaeon]